MTAVFGFNVGALISLGDMEQTIEYISENTDKEVNHMDKDVTSKFLLNDLPFPITSDINTQYEEDDEYDIGEDEFDIDDSEFDDLINEDDFEDIDNEDFGDLGDFEDGTDIKEEVIDKNKLISDLRKETPVVKKETSNNELDEIQRLREELEKEKKLRLQAEQLTQEKERKQLQNDIAKEKIKREQAELRIQEQNRLKQEEKAKLKAEEQRKQKEKQLAKLREAKRKELIEKRKQEMIDKERLRKQKLEEPQNIYDTMEIEALYNEVRKYMERSGVSKSIVEVNYLNDKFGRHNIKKLILKSYLISIGKGVTIGR